MGSAWLGDGRLSHAEPIADAKCGSKAAVRHTWA
jgi:hypothetical protein